MANLTYTADILANALDRAGEPTDGNSDFHALAQNYLNMVYMQICRGGSALSPDINEDWYWLLKPRPGVLILQPPITTLTANVTLGSSTVVLSAAPTDHTGNTISTANWFLKAGENFDIFGVFAHSAGSTTLTLDGPYTGTTTSGASCTLFLTDYALAADVMRIVAPMRIYNTNGWGSRDDYKVYSSSLDTLEEGSPLALIETGLPDFYAPIGDNPSGTRRVRFNKAGGPDAHRVEYEYLFRPLPLTFPGTTEEPILPLQWRHILADFTLAYLFGIKHDDRSTGAAQVAMAELRGMAIENRYQTTTANRSAFRLRRGSGSFRRALTRTSSGLYIG